MTARLSAGSNTVWVALKGDAEARCSCGRGQRWRPGRRRMTRRGHRTNGPAATESRVERLNRKEGDLERA